jgi:hypothetical protein
MLPGPVALELLKMVARRKPEILEDHGGVERLARVRLTRLAGKPLPNRPSTAFAARLPFVLTIMGACITT